MTTLASILSLFMLTMVGGLDSPISFCTQGNMSKATLANHEPEKAVCDLISESAIKSVFSIPESAITEKRIGGGSYPSCVYKWKSITYSKTMAVSGREINIDAPTEMTLVMVKEATEKEFQRSTQSYSNKQVQSGIGEMAVWDGGYSQLTFLSNGYLIHINVKQSAVESENKAVAIKMAALVIENL